MFVWIADVIFLIYLYQRWKYPVDKSRVNEFGFGGEEKKEENKRNGVEPPSESIVDASEESKKSKWNENLLVPGEMDFVF